MNESRPSNARRSTAPCSPRCHGGESNWTSNGAVPFLEAAVDATLSFSSTTVDDMHVLDVALLPHSSPECHSQFQTGPRPVRNTAWPINEIFVQVREHRLFLKIATAHRECSSRNTSSLPERSTCGRPPTSALREVFNVLPLSRPRGSGQDASDGSYFASTFRITRRSSAAGSFTSLRLRQAT